MTTTRKLLKAVRKIHRNLDHWAMRRQAYRLARLTPGERDALRRYVGEALRRRP
jgi:hypothetical protein